MAPVKRFADLVVRRPRTVLAVAAVLAVVAAAFGWETPRLLGRASNDFVAKGSESLRAEAAVERATGSRRRRSCSCSCAIPRAIASRGS